MTLVALLDAAGVITEVNQAWRDFCLACGGDPERAGPGTSYLDVCARAAGDPGADEVADAIRAAVAGLLTAPVSVLVPWHSHEQIRWFQVQVSSRTGDRRAGDDRRVGDDRRMGAVVTVSPALVEGSVPQPLTARDLVETLPDGLLVSDEAGVITYVNRPLELLCGYTRAELIGRPVEVLVPGSSRRGHRALHAAFRSARRTRTMGEGAPLDLRRRDGSLLAVEIALAPVDVAGRAMTAAAVRDVTAQRAADQERRWLLEVLDLMPDVVLVGRGPGLRIGYANQAAADLLGYSRDQLLRMTGGDVIPGLDVWDPSRIQAVIEAGGGDHLVGPTQLRTADGRLVPGESHVQIVRELADSDGGGPVFVVAVRDIRDRLAQEQRLLVSEESFRTSFEKAPIGMAVVRLADAGRRRIILRANPALATIFREPANRLTGMDFAGFTEPEDRAASAAWAQELATGLRTEHAQLKRFRRRDGSLLWAEMRASAVRFPDLPGPTVLIHLVDVTERQVSARRDAQRAAMTQVVADVATSVLAGEPVSRVYQQIVAGIAAVFDAEEATVCVPDHARDTLRILAAVGPVSGGLMTGAIPASRGIAHLLSQQDRMAIPEPPPEVDDLARRRLGPAAAAWFGSHPAAGGLITTSRPPGADPFTAAEVDLLADLARQVGLAVELGAARLDQERLAVLEERQRIARDLHDTVIQDLIAAGMQLDASLRRQEAPALRERDQDLIAALENAVRTLRAAVHELRTPGRPLTETLRESVDAAGVALGHAPTLAISGPVDEVTEDLRRDVTAVVREALSNIARHARATLTGVTLAVDEERLVLTVRDNGTGIHAVPRPGHGLDNIRYRAAAHAGSATFISPTSGGTELVWTVPLNPQW